jgi:hypothetical protein
MSSKADISKEETESLLKKINQEFYAKPSYEVDQIIEAVKSDLTLKALRECLKISLENRLILLEIKDRLSKGSSSSDKFPVSIEEKLETNYRRPSR